MIEKLQFLSNASTTFLRQGMKKLHENNRQQPRPV